MSAHTLKVSVGYFADEKVIAAVERLQAMGLSDEMSGAPLAPAGLELAITEMAPTLAERGRPNLLPEQRSKAL